jgi:hypothetical protein
LILATHSEIGKFLYLYILQKTQLTINKKSFVYGNIKPDIDKKLRNIPHRINNLIIFLEVEIQNLLSENNSVDEFSEKLGMVCHFLSDSFCSFHFYDKLWKKNIFEHIIYEIKLHYISKTVLKEFSYNNLLIQNTKDLNIIYKILENDYTKEKEKMSNDIKYALTFSILVINSINTAIKHMDAVA